jgi:hypothetical protein
LCLQPVEGTVQHANMIMLSLTIVELQDVYELYVFKQLWSFKIGRQCAGRCWPLAALSPKQCECKVLFRLTLS